MATFRICGQRGCPKATEGRFCPDHTRQHEARRGTKAQRGYGKEFYRERKSWVPRVEAGLVDCWRCRTLIQPGSNWHLGHDDLDRTIIRGPEHALCNLSAAGKAAHQ